MANCNNPSIISAFISMIFLN